MRIQGVVGLILLVFVLIGSALAQESQAPLTLEEGIKIALSRSANIHSAMVGVIGAEYREKEAITNFLPKWTGIYSYTRYSSPSVVGVAGGAGVTQRSRDVYSFNTTVNQPLYTGGANLANLRLQKMGVDLSKVTVELTKLDTVLQVRQGYFTILTAGKLRETAEQTVKQFAAQLEVSKAFFEVGIVAKNDVLQAEVRLANAQQNLIIAENGVALAKSSFNKLLRRDINTPFEVVDILQYKPSGLQFEDSLDEALRQRPEIKSANLTIGQAKENVKIARSALFPQINVAGNYSEFSDVFTLDGYKYFDRWNVLASATLNIFDWGNNYFKVGENKVKVTQAEDAKIQVVDGIVLEVKQDYLVLVQAEKNIGVAQTAIAQAEENLRVFEEQYKYQVATQTDVLNAVTLLEQARVNYYTALGTYNIAKASLDRAMGRMYP